MKIVVALFHHMWINVFMAQRTQVDLSKENVDALKKLSKDFYPGVSLSLIANWCIKHGIGWYYASEKAQGNKATK